MVDRVIKSHVVADKKSLLQECVKIAHTTPNYKMMEKDVQLLSVAQIRS